MKRLLLGLVCILSVIALPLPIFAQSNLQTGTAVTLPADVTIATDYFAAGETVILDGTVTGDAYIAGGDVTINGTIEGDLLVAGGNININGQILQDIRSVGGNITIVGSVGKNVTVLGGSINVAPTASITGSLAAAGGNLTILGTIGTDVHTAGGQVNIGGQIGNNLLAGVGNFTLTSTSQIAGNVQYWSDKQVTIAPGATVSGTIQYHETPRMTKPEAETVQKASVGILSMVKILSFVSALLVGCLLLAVFPTFTSRVASSMSSQWAMHLGVGFLAIIVAPIGMMLLIFTIVGIPLAMLLLVGMLFGLWMAKLFVSITLGMMVVKRFRLSGSKYLTFAVGLVLFYIVGLIPFIGWLFTLLATLIGFGALITTKKTMYSELRKEDLI